MLPDDTLKVTPNLQHSGLPSDHNAKPQTTYLNDKRTIYTLLAKLWCPFTTMDGVHLSKHVLTLLIDLPNIVQYTDTINISDVCDYTMFLRIYEI